MLLLVFLVVVVVVSGCDVVVVSGCVVVDSRCCCCCCFWLLLYLVAVVVVGFRDHIHKPLFSSELMNGPNTLECYILLGWKDFPETNPFAYSAHSQVMKKMKCCEHSP